MASDAAHRVFGTLINFGGYTGYSGYNVQKTKVFCNQCQKTQW